MALVTTIDNASQFRDLFAECGRGDQFSYEGLGILFDHLEELSDSTGEHVEIDVVGLCCDYSEDKPEDIARSYEIPMDGLDDDDLLAQVENFLQESGVYVSTTSDGTIVYNQF